MWGIIGFPAIANTTIQTGITFPNSFIDKDFFVFLTPYHNGSLITSFFEGDSNGNTQRTLSGTVVSIQKSAKAYNSALSWYAVGQWK